MWGCLPRGVSATRGVCSSPGRVALGMSPSSPGLGFLICEVGVIVGPPPPDAWGGDRDNSDSLKARPHASSVPSAPAPGGPCWAVRLGEDTGGDSAQSPATGCGREGRTGKQTGRVSRCPGSVGLGWKGVSVRHEEGQSEGGAFETGPAGRGAGERGFATPGAPRPARQSRGHRTRR